MKIENVNQTCCACPTAWTFTTDNDREAYVRYRWGLLRVTVSQPKGQTENFLGFHGEDDTVIFSDQIGGPYDGSIDWDSVESLIVPLNVEEEVMRASATNALHAVAFDTKPEYRRKVWREGIESMNQWIIDTAKQDEENEKQGRGFSILCKKNPPKPYSEDQINELLDKYEREYQEKRAKQESLERPKHREADAR